jgi:polysaccharide export outer membrane protein
LKTFAILFIAWVSACLLSAPAQSQPTQPAYEYRLGPGDVVRITVYNNPDLTTEAQITQEGRISFPLIGEVQIGGLEKGQAEQMIARRLGDGGFVVKPQVNLLVLGFKSQQISVLGQVNRPGKYPIEQASTLADLLAMAGGISQGGADVITHITREADGRTVKRDIDIHEALKTGEMEKNFPVANGDIIFVPRAPLFYIYGEVQRPGAYRLEKEMTVMQALSVGGGLNVRGTERGIRINRHSGDGTIQSIECKMSDKVQENDVIYVKESLF